MKKQYICLFFACLTFLLTGCDKYLDIQPTGSVIPHTLAEYRALWLNACTTVPADRGLAGMGADEMFVSNKTIRINMELPNVGRVRQLLPRPYRSTGPYYEVLFFANFIIEHHDEINEGSQNEIAQLTGEAYLMRAYMHFILVNLHGQPYTKPGAPATKSIPLKLDTDLEKQLFRNTVSEVYTSILDDLKSAEALLNVENGMTLLSPTVLPKYAFRLSAHEFTSIWATGRMLTHRRKRLLRLKMYWKILRQTDLSCLTNISR